jgi:hypothetical protein
MLHGVDESVNLVEALTKTAAGRKQQMEVAPAAGME